MVDADVLASALKVRENEIKLFMWLTLMNAIPLLYLPSPVLTDNGFPRSR